MPTQRPTASPIQAALWTRPFLELFSDFSEDFSNLSDQELHLWQQLEDEVYCLHQLAAEQEAALLQLMDMVEQFQADLDCANSVSAADNLAADQLLEPQVFGEVGQQRVTGVLQLAQQLLEGIGGAIVLLGTAISDRIYASRSNAPKNDLTNGLTNDPTASSTRRSIGLRHGAVSSPEGLSDRSSDLELQLEDSEADPIEVLPTLQEALTITLGAAVLRIVLDRIVQVYPALWFIAVLLMVVPAAVAIYRTHCSPRSGFLWGFRLTLILVGLLLGRRI